MEGIIIFDKNEIIKNYFLKYKIDHFFNEEIIEKMKIINIKPKETLLYKGMNFEYFYFFLEGKMKIYTIEKNGKSLLLRFYNPLEILGDVELFTSDIVKTYVDSIEKSVLIAVETNFFKDYIKKNNELMIFIIQNLGRKLDSISSLSSFNLLHPLENRFAAYLKGMEDIYENFSAETENLKEISELLGSSYRHLLRIIKKFEKNDLIKREGKKIRIINKDEINFLSKDIYE